MVQIKNFSCTSFPASTEESNVETKTRKKTWQEVTTDEGKVNSIFSNKYSNTGTECGITYLKTGILFILVERKI